MMERTKKRRLRALESCPDESYDELLRRHQTDIRLLLRRSTAPDNNNSNNNNNNNHSPSSSSSSSATTDDIQFRAKLRECYQLLTVHRTTTNDVSSRLLSFEDFDDIDTGLGPVTQRLTNDLLGCLTSKTTFTSSSSATRSLCLSALRELTDGEPPESWSDTTEALNGGVDFAATYGELRATSLVPLLLQMDVGSRILRANLLNCVIWLDNADVATRSSALACVTRMAEEHRCILEETGGVVEMVEAKLSESLVRTRLRSGARHASSSVLSTAFGLLSGTQTMDATYAEDPDGTTGREFFTVLNTIPHETHRYVGTQVSHVHWFSTVRKWLKEMYATKWREEEEREKEKREKEDREKESVEEEEKKSTRKMKRREKQTESCEMRARGNREKREGIA